MAIPVLTLGACGEKKNPLLVTSTAPLRSAAVPANHKRRLQTGFRQSARRGPRGHRPHREQSRRTDLCEYRRSACVQRRTPRQRQQRLFQPERSEHERHDAEPGAGNLACSDRIQQRHHAESGAFRTGQSGLRPTRLARPDARTVSPARKRPTRISRATARRCPKRIKDLPRVNRQTVATDPEIQPEHARRDQRLYPAHHRLGAGRRTARLCPRRSGGRGQRA